MKNMFNMLKFNDVEFKNGSFHVSFVKMGVGYGLQSVSEWVYMESPSLKTRGFDLL
jgi:hypothetical protein